MYDVPDLTTDIRYGPRERGEREERIVDIYVSADNLNPDPGTQQDAVQQNTAQEQHGGKTKHYNEYLTHLCYARALVELVSDIRYVSMQKKKIYIYIYCILFL